jgi:hypothetical protein
MILSRYGAERVLNVYRETHFPRWVKATICQSPEWKKRKRYFNEELKRRGFVKIKENRTSIYVGEIREQVNSMIYKKKGAREYGVKPLSFLHFIEGFIAEGSGWNQDMIKLELVLLLIHKYDMFRETEKVVERYAEYGLTVFEPFKGEEYAEVGFLTDICIYLFDVGRMLVSELGHDFLISKRIGMEPKLTPNQDYDEKYEYFREIPYFYMKED